MKYYEGWINRKPVATHFIEMMMELVLFYNSCVIVNNTLEAHWLQKMLI